MTDEALDLAAQFGQRLRLEMANKRIRQSDIARELGVTNSTVSGWTNGTFVPTAVLMVKLARYLDVPLAYLLEGTTETPRTQIALELEEAMDNTPPTKLRSPLQDLLVLLADFSDEQVKDVYKYAVFLIGKDKI